MKFAITGHTRGLGAVIHDRFAHLGHEVLGVSRNNIGDLSTHDGRADAVYKIREFPADAVILNCRHGQRELLERLMHSSWAQPGRTVVLIGSRAPDVGILTEAPLYAAEKAANDLVARHYAHTRPGGCRIVNLRFGYIKGIDRSTEGLDPNDVAQIIYNVLDDPGHRYLRDATFYA